MKRLLLVATLLLPPPATADSVLIYRPETVTGQLPTTPDEGIAVKVVTIKRGDSLSKLSRRFTGKGYYFPQILLFNRIADPNLIFTGEIIRVPIPHNLLARHAAPPVGPETLRQEAPESSSAAATATRPTLTAAGEQELFTKAKFQYRKRHYRAALGLFDRFLREYPTSLQASDAIFHRGECYLKLSRR